MLIKVKLNEVLKKKRYSQQEVSDATGIHTNTLSLICTGKTHGISFQVLEKLCSFLNCKIQDIIEYQKDKVA